VAEQIAAIQRGVKYAASNNGRGTCHIEFGHDQVGRVDVSFLSGQRPLGILEGPAPELAADKISLGSEQVRCWFDRTWPES